jgi:hypothetical protein
MKRKTVKHKSRSRMLTKKEFYKWKNNVILTLKYIGANGQIESDIIKMKLSDQSLLWFLMAMQNNSTQPITSKIEII